MFPRLCLALSFLFHSHQHAAVMATRRSSRSTGEGSGGAGSGGGGSSSSAEDILEEANNAARALLSFCVFEWEVPLDNITSADNSRPISEAGVRIIKESIEKIGFMPTAPPQIMFPDLAEGQDCTAEKALTLRAITIDGNHRYVRDSLLFLGHD